MADSGQFRTFVFVRQEALKGDPNPGRLARGAPAGRKRSASETQTVIRTGYPTAGGPV
jgi:hypothetical protein